MGGGPAASEIGGRRGTARPPSLSGGIVTPYFSSFCCIYNLTVVEERGQLQHDNPAKGDHGGPALLRRDRRRADHARPPRQPRRTPTPAAKRLGVGPLR